MKFSDLPSSYFKLILIIALGIILAACGTSNRGGYYKNDGPGKRNVDIDSIPNAVPKDEPYIAATLKPYTINGKRYVPLKSAEGFVEEGRASWYGRRYHGRKTSTGEVYDMFKMTAAHPTLPLPSYARVTNVNNQRSVIVRLNDRGPFIGDRIIDLSYVAAQKLGVVSAGTGNVIVESLSASVQNSRSSQQLRNSRATILPSGPIPAGDSDANYQYNSSQPQTSASSANTQGSQALPQLVPNTQLPESQGTLNPSNNTAPTGTNSLQDQWIQVGAFSVLKNAEDLLSRLKLSGYNNGQVVSQQALFKVLVGPLSAEEFSQTMLSLKRNGYSAIKAKQ